MMKKILALGLALAMLFSLNIVFAESEAGTAPASKVTGNIENGNYILTVQVDPDEKGDWTADEMAQDNSVVDLVVANYVDGAFVAQYAPTGDGEVTVHIRHYTENRVCNEVFGFDLLVKDGAIQEVTGGSYTASPAEEEQNPYFSGEWLEKDTQFTVINVTPEISGGWNVEITSPISHGAWVIRGTAYYDCDYDAFIYTEGTKYDLPTDDKAQETQTATGLWGSLKFAGTEDNLQLVWYGMEETDGQEITFERAPEESR